MALRLSLEQSLSYKKKQIQDEKERTLMESMVYGGYGHLNPEA
jgi:hypothetical protein